jgi:cell division septation protein DedD/thioredoxin-related protein
MKKALLVALTACVFMATAFYPVDKQVFVLNDIPSAQAKAQASHKLLLVQFTAKWCAPCKMMDENTWTHPDLLSWMQSNCVASKIDIENFDGMSYTHQYKVKSVPTILVFSADGRALGRYENSISATHLIKYLSQFDLPENRGGSVDLAPVVPADMYPNPDSKPAEGYTMTAHPSRTLTAILEDYGKSKGEMAADNWINGEMAALGQMSTTNKNDDLVASAEPAPQHIDNQEEPTLHALTTEVKPFVSRVISPSVVQPTAKPTKMTAAPEKVKPIQSTADLLYTVQLGAYASKQGAINSLKSVASRTKEQVRLLAPTELHDQYFRIITGTFYTKDQAKHYVSDLKNAGIDGFVRILPETDSAMSAVN